MNNFEKGICQSFPLSWRVWVHESIIDSERGPVNMMRSFFQEMVRFLERIRIQPFELHINCVTASGPNVYIYDRKLKKGVVYVQNFGSPLVLARVISHELCHYIMDNHLIRSIRNSKGGKVSSYEEVFAEMFSFLQLKNLQEWCRREAPGWHFVEHEVKSNLHSYDRPLDVCNQKGILALPLFEEGLLPDYDSCAAIALSLLPYFEKHPELWKILPHVQNVDPLANWREFFSHMLDTADDSCRGPLKEMIDHLFP